MKNLNKKKGHVHNELDNYRSVQVENPNSTLIVDRPHSHHADHDLKHSHSNYNSRNNAESSSFLQTLSDFGKRIKSMLAPKDNSPSPQQYATPKTTERELHKSSFLPPTSNRNTNLLVNNEGSRYRKSVVNLLKNDKRRMSIVGGTQSTLNKQDHHSISYGFMTPLHNSTQEQKQEEEYLHAPKKVVTHRRNSSVNNNNLYKVLKKSHTAYFEQAGSNEDKSLLDKDENISTNVSLDESKENKKTLVFNPETFDLYSKNMYFLNELRTQSSNSPDNQIDTIVKNLDRSFSKAGSEIFNKKDMIKPPSKSIPDTDL